MPTLLRSRLLPAATALTALVTVVTVALPAPALAATPDEAAVSAAAWLADELTDAGTVVGSYPGADGAPVVYTDYGRTIDAALGLLAAGGHDEVIGRTLTTVTTSSAVAEYTQGAPADRADAAYAGATAKLAFFVEATGGDATSVGGVDLLAQLLSLVTDDGRLADRSTFGNYANVYGHAFALLALDAAGRQVPDPLVQSLLGARCDDGSFPQEYQPKAGEPCAGQVDATGLVLQALAAVDLGGSDAAQAAAAWLTSKQQDDGSFPGEAPVNSTGYAAAGLIAIDASAGEARTWLASQQNGDGGLRRGAGEDTSSDVFATAQALPALAGTSFPASVRRVSAQSVPCVGAAITLPRTAITATEKAEVRVRAASGTTVDLFAYSRPSTQFRRVRVGTGGADGLSGFKVGPATNTRLYAQQRGCASGPSTVMTVAPLLTLHAVRNGPRDYTFSGRTVPARAGGFVLALHRIDPDGKAPVRAHVRADANGVFRVRVVFSGTGRFGFDVRTGKDVQNDAGRSPVRTLLIS